MERLTHKRGDAFEIACQCLDDAGLPESILAVEIASQIRNQRLELIADLQVIKHEIAGDDATKGHYTLLCIDTMGWDIGTLLWDIKYTENGKSLRTETRGIDVSREVTE